MTRIWSASGLRDPRAGLAKARPFRAPHHTASRAAMVGGGSTLRPGEVSLAHRGVLFLDELPEFSRDVFESLRQPLEEGRVVISRRTASSVFPAACTLVAAMNPCPCGYLGHPQKACRCTAATLARYRSRISGPLLDRVDVLIEVPPLAVTQLDQAASSDPSAAVRERVAAAREYAWARTHGETGPLGQSFEDRCRLDSDARRMLRRAFVQDGLSGRAFARIAGLARTIADLDQVDAVGADHLAEALAFRLDYRRIGF